MRNHHADIYYRLGPFYINVGYKFYPNLTYQNRITFGFAYGKFYPEKGRAYKARTLTFMYGKLRSIINA